MSERMSAYVPESMSEYMPDRMSKDMPERMSDRMSECAYIRIHIYICTYTCSGMSETMSE